MTVALRVVGGLEAEATSHPLYPLRPPAWLSRHGGREKEGGRLTACAVAARTISVGGRPQLVELGLQPFVYDAKGLIASAGAPLAWWEGSGPPPVDLAISMGHAFSIGCIRGVIDLEASLALDVDLIFADDVDRLRRLVRARLAAAEGASWVDMSTAPGREMAGFGDELLDVAVSSGGLLPPNDCPLCAVARLPLLLDRVLADGRTVLAAMLPLKSEARSDRG